MPMPAVVASVEALCNRLARSGLVRRQYVQTVYQQWKKQGLPSGLASDVDRFAKWLVANHYLTAYQAQQLVLGQTDHFFLNHYRLLDRIGQGRMAGIYKAAHISGHVVAVKLMPAAKSKDPTVLARFRREGKMAVRLKHPNVVRTFHIGREGERFYLVMEYLEGETLEDLLKRRKKLPFPEAVRLIHQALLGLQYINDEGMVHRDLKPGNLMLGPPRPPGAPDTTMMQTVKILDIGLGRVMFDEHATGDQDNLTLTNEGVMLGTPDYMAPEQSRNAHTVDIRADMYALGCVLYHLIAGRLPFIETSPVMQMLSLIHI
jgi:serine/threonine protein kinase